MHAASLKPHHGLLAGIYDTIGIVDSRELAQAFNSKRLTGRTASVEAVVGDEVNLSDGTTLQVLLLLLLLLPLPPPLLLPPLLPPPLLLHAGPARGANANLVQSYSVPPPDIGCCEPS
jgi:hypothetical protein